MEEHIDGAVGQVLVRFMAEGFGECDDDEVGEQVAGGMLAGLFVGGRWDGDAGRLGGVGLTGDCEKLLKCHGGVLLRVGVQVAYLGGVGERHVDYVFSR